MSKKKTYGLIGKKLGHSFSPQYFKEKFQLEGIRHCVYVPFELEEIASFPGLLKKNPSISGLNVTIPYKQAVMPYLDELSEVAREVGAVNTIIFKNNKLLGDNTDVYGFKMSLMEFIPDQFEGNALILGTGGASRAVQYVLRQLEIPYLLVSRREIELGIRYDEITKSILADHRLIINTTPLGMYPDVEAFPAIDYDQLTEDHLLYDLIYNPIETQFLLKGKAKKARIKSGGDMLIFQAEKAWNLWNL